MLKVNRHKKNATVLLVGESGTSLGCPRHRLSSAGWELLADTSSDEGEQWHVTCAVVRAKTSAFWLPCPVHTLSL